MGPSFSYFSEASTQTSPPEEILLSIESALTQLEIVRVPEEVKSPTKPQRGMVKPKFGLSISTGEEEEDSKPAKQAPVTDKASNNKTLDIS